MKHKKPEEEKTKKADLEQQLFETQTELLLAQQRLDESEKSQFLLETTLIEKGVL